MASDESNGAGKTRINRAALIAMTRRMAAGSDGIAAPPPKPGQWADASKTDFSTLPVYQEMELHRAIARHEGLSNPYFIESEGIPGPIADIGGRTVINFASYNYLGFNGSPEVAKSATAALRQYGSSASASRPTAGNRPLHRELERRLADHYAADKALTFVSGHATNVSTIGDLMQPADLILFDAFSHNSITVGAKLSGAARRIYAHNDMAELEAALAQSRAKHDRVLIVAEGLYSMDGDMPDLARLIEIKKTYGAWLMIDEAHALGVLGKSGRGVFEQQGIDPREVDIWMGTLSKTLSGCGGYIAGPAALIEILQFNASGFMFSVGMSPVLAAAALRSLELMYEHPERVARLQRNGRCFLEAARKAGLETGLSQGFAVVPVIIGNSLQAIKLANRLLERGVLTTPVTYPAVGMKEARLRFFITSEHTREQIEKAVAITAQELRQLADAKFGLGKADDGE